MKKLLPALDPSGQESETHISEYLEILYKRKTFILIFLVLFVGVVAYRTFTATALYESGVELVIEPKTLNSLSTGKRLEYETLATQMLDMATHFKLIRSKPVIRSVIARLELDRRSEKETPPGLWDLMGQKVSGLFQSLTETLFPPEQDLAPERMLDPATRKINQLIRQIQNNLEVTEIKKTRMIRISVRDRDPKLSADIANALAQSYIEYDLSKRVDSSRQNLEWLNTELLDLKKELEDNERTFYEYKSRHKVFSMEGKQKVAGQKIAEFNNRYLEARKKRLDLDSKINELQRHMQTAKGVINVSSLIHNNLIEEIYNKIGDLEVEYTKLLKFYKPKHPKIIQVKSEIDKNQRRLDYELEKELSNLKSERAVAAESERVLQTTIGEFEQDALDSSSNELTYSILQRNVTTSQKLYDLLLSRIKESDILKDNAESNILIVDSADIPSRPVYPRKMRNLLLGLFFGLTGGCLLAFFFEYMDQTLRTQEDVQSYLNLPVLTVIPEADRP